MIRRRQREKGFTLIEVLVSIAIIGIAGITLISLFTISLNNNQASKGSIENTVYIKNVMEEIKSEFSALPKGNRDIHSLINKANQIQGNHPKSKITIQEKNAEKNLYTITVEYTGIGEGRVDKLVSYIYLP